MLTKTEYSTSTSSLSTVFSSQLMDLNSTLGVKPVTVSKTTKKSSSFKNRLRDRINKNKERIVELNQVIEESKQDILTIKHMKKALFENEVAPLVTFVDLVKNTTDAALLSLQRELVEKDKEHEYVVYDRNVIWLDRKLTSDVNAYLKHYDNTNRLFKKNFLDKENERFRREVNHSERLLKEGESLMKVCKQQIKQKDQKIKQLLKTIEQKEDQLSAKQQELSELSTLLGRESDSSNTKMKSYILNAKLKNTKQDIRRLHNEKLDLEATEIEYTKDIEHMKLSLREMEKRNQKEQRQVKVMEKTLGTITAKISEDIEKHSLVQNSEVKLKDYLKREKAYKEKLLKEVNNQKKVKSNRYEAFLETKTVKPIDWNQIDDEQASFDSQAKNTWNEEESKFQSPIEAGEKQEDLSFLSFDPDWESTQSDSRLPIGLQNDSSKNILKGSKTPSSSICKPLATSCAKRSKFETTKNDEDVSDNDFWSCNKILEEADEESLNNLTPRLEEEREREANLFEETQTRQLRKSAEDTFSKEIYASKTTLETEVSSLNKYELDSESTFNDKNEKEHPLSLSIISSGSINNEDRFISPASSACKNRVPKLNLSKVKKTLGITSLNSSIISTTNYSSADSKLDRTTTDASNAGFCIKSISKALRKGGDGKPVHLKNQLSHGKPVTNKKLTKGLKTVTGQYYNTLIKNSRKNSSDQTDSWRESKNIKPSTGFSATHWGFNK